MEGKTPSHLLLGGGGGCALGGQPALLLFFCFFVFLLFPFQSCLPCGEGGKEIKMADDGLTQEINPHLRPTAASLLVPGCAASLWGFVSSRAKKKKKKAQHESSLLSPYLHLSPYPISLSE